LSLYRSDFRNRRSKPPQSRFTVCHLHVQLSSSTPSAPPSA